jgi:hypothetical protein
MDGLNNITTIALAAPLDGSALLVSEANVETATTLTQAEADALTKAILWGKAHVEIRQSATASTPAFTITALEFSIDGSNYATLRTFDSAVSCGGSNGQKALVPLHGYAMACDSRITKIRFVMGGSAPDGTNKCKLACVIVCMAP